LCFGGGGAMTFDCCDFDLGVVAVEAYYQIVIVSSKLLGDCYLT
jgi:hypothetical protein